MQEVKSECVSIVIPAYNAEAFIAETIGSVQRQTYENWELIVIDDGSNDATAGIVRSFLSDSRISYHYQTNSGVSVARNSGIEKCNGSYIAFLDADDIWMERNLQQKIDLLKSDPSCQWIFSDMLEFLQESGIVREAPHGRDDDILDNILLWEGEVIPAPASNVIVRSSAFLSQHIRFDRTMSTAADQDFCLQLAKQLKGRRLPEPLLTYRVSGNSMSRNIALMEKDHRNVYNKALRDGLFRSAAFRRRCFSRLYFILSANWWANGKKFRGIYFMIRSVLCYPPVLRRYANKFFAGGSRNQSAG